MVSSNGARADAKAKSRADDFTLVGICVIKCPDAEGDGCEGEALVYAYRSGPVAQLRDHTQAVCPTCGYTWYLAVDPLVHWLRL